MSAKHIDLHWFQFDQSAKDLAADLALLDREEVAQFEAMRNSAAAAAFVQRRAARRRILARHLSGIEPSKIELTSNVAGKPVLLPPHDGLHFSASHGRYGGVAAVSEDFPIGVDIEFERSVDHARFAEKILAPDERQHYLALPDDARPHALLAAWTTKEALTKALGLALNLNFMPQMSVLSGKAKQGWREARLSAPLPDVADWQVWTDSLSSAFAKPALISIAAPKICTVEIQPFS